MRSEVIERMVRSLRELEGIPPYDEDRITYDRTKVYLAVKDMGTVVEFTEARLQTRALYNKWEAVRSQFLKETQ